MQKSAFSPAGFPIDGLSFTFEIIVELGGRMTALRMARLKRVEGRNSKRGGQL